MLSSLAHFRDNSFWRRGRGWTVSWNTRPRGRPDYRAIALVDWIERADEDRL